MAAQAAYLVAQPRHRLDHVRHFGRIADRRGDRHFGGQHRAQIKWHRLAVRGGDDQARLELADAHHVRDDARCAGGVDPGVGADRSEEHTSELQSLMRISYAVFCLKKKTIVTYTQPHSCDKHRKTKMSNYTS